MRSEALIASGEAVNNLRRSVSFDLAILFLYDSQSDALVARHVTGDQKRIVKEMRLAVGRGVSGWVAANRRSALNSDAVLDLGDVARLSQPELRYALSVCLAVDECLLGVLTLYSSAPFAEAHVLEAEALSPQIASIFERTAPFTQPVQSVKKP